MGGAEQGQSSGRGGAFASLFASQLGDRGEKRAGAKEQGAGKAQTPRKTPGKPVAKTPGTASAKKGAGAGRTPAQRNDLTRYFAAVGTPARIVVGGGGVGDGGEVAGGGGVEAGSRLESGGGEGTESGGSGDGGRRGGGGGRSVGDRLEEQVVVVEEEEEEEEEGTALGLWDRVERKFVEARGGRPAGREAHGPRPGIGRAQVREHEQPVASAANEQDSDDDIFAPRPSTHQRAGAGAGKAGSSKAAAEAAAAQEEAQAKEAEEMPAMMAVARTEADERGEERLTVRERAYVSSDWATGEAQDSAQESALERERREREARDEEAERIMASLDEDALIRSARRAWGEREREEEREREVRRLAREEEERIMASLDEALVVRSARQARDRVERGVAPAAGGASGREGGGGGGGFVQSGGGGPVTSGGKGGGNGGTVIDLTESP